jgi:hypothetical protein
MAHIVKYSILRAVPDIRRGECVNVGLVAFLPDRVDVRYAELSKLRALTGSDWHEYISIYSQSVQKMFEAGSQPEELASRFQLVDSTVKLSELGWFIADDEEVYENQLSNILKSLVSKPKRKQIVKQTAINSEMARKFKQMDALATKDETTSSNKIVRDITISAEEKLRVDFGWKNGKLNFAATLDLRWGGVSQGTAALKAIALDKARQDFGGEDKVNRIGVYAVEPIAEKEFRSQIALLSDYSQHTFNWAEPRSRASFIRFMSDNLHPPIFAQTDS